MKGLIPITLLALALPDLAPEDSAAFAERVRAGLDSMLSIEHADHDARTRALAESFDETWDYGAFSSALLADSSEDQREEIEGALRGLVLATFAGRLDAGEPRTHRSAATEPLRDGMTAETITLLDGERERARIRLLLRPVDDSWRVVEFEIDSETGKRSWGPAFRSRLELEGVAGLLADLRARTVRWSLAPVEVVARLQSGLIECMKAAKGSDYPTRYGRISPLILDTHDLDSSAKLTFSRAWRKLSPEERSELGRVFRELSIATYAARFDGFHDESFSEPVAQDVKRAVLVKSRLKKSDGGEHHFDYLMRKSAGRWQIVNIVVDGVSDLALKRQEYGDVIEREGFEPLIARLRAEIEGYEAGGKD